MSCIDYQPVLNMSWCLLLTRATSRVHYDVLVAHTHCILQASMKCMTQVLTMQKGTTGYINHDARGRDAPACKFGKLSLGALEFARVRDNNLLARIASRRANCVKPNMDVRGALKTTRAPFCWVCQTVIPLLQRL